MSVWGGAATSRIGPTVTTAGQGGEGGIRTHDPLRDTRVPGVRTRPNYATSPRVAILPLGIGGHNRASLTRGSRATKLPAMRPNDRLAADSAAEARVIGAIGPTGGVLLAVVAGLHGNEPAGVLACQRVLKALPAGALRGRFVALRGNLTALASGQRFVDHDLNRHWTLAHVAAARAGAAASGVEDFELAGLDRALTDAASSSPGVHYLLDLHTTSAPSAPFALVADAPEHRALAGRLGVPLVLGLDVQLEGTLLATLAHEGWVGVGIEGGRHDDPASAERLEAAVWLTMVSAGLLGPSDVPDFDGLRGRLATACDGLPVAVEVRYRHAIRPADAFRMRTGFVNFQPVALGEMLATDRHGTVQSPETGRILMPLYQGLGEEGFFLVRTVREPERPAGALAGSSGRG